MNAELIERCRVMLGHGFSAYRVGKEVGLHPNTVKYWCVPGWKEEMIEGVRRWQAENPERVKELNRVSARNRAEKVNADARAWRSRNPEKAAEYGRKWRKANWKQLRLKATHMRLLNDAVVMRDEWVYLRYLGMPVSQFVRVMCEEAARRGLSPEWRHGWELDHYRPACAFDLEREEDRWVCFHWSNFQPVTRSQNLRKGGREPEGPWLPIVEEDKAGLPEGFNLHQDGWRYVPSWIEEGFKAALEEGE